jgi:hypothetical protein
MSSYEHRPVVHGPVPEQQLVNHSGLQFDSSTIFENQKRVASIHPHQDRLVCYCTLCSCPRTQRRHHLASDNFMILCITATFSKCSEAAASARVAFFRFLKSMCHDANKPQMRSGAVCGGKLPGARWMQLEDATPRDVYWLGDIEFSRRFATQRNLEM